MRSIAAFLLLLVACPARTEVTLVQVIKSENKMLLMDGQKVVKTYHIALGASPKGHKMQEGDQKTPEGRYILDYKKEDSAYYRAMHLSYPNSRDRAQAEVRGVSPGGFIMVHGQRNGLGWFAPLTQRFNWTQGCIALSNSEMDDFMALVQTGTPIEIRW
ncbi:murein L,D-transpeptidase family protein [Microbulbifer sp. 2205BS26-8]|uniref:L,D-transpeptidase family protein n=1 Tax=Microbulbifer sp. 2205BS26-8 TaxID=3064386 RepID=UPI00273D34BC|nr:L,D-transpeptidase family protein [Microbulbifer sp. 2205BS26-8]MDP5210219.1 L,D-transpeptidase family protein [Microbulbifer sp. 2205BS26-8]